MCKTRRQRQATDSPKTAVLSGAQCTLIVLLQLQDAAGPPNIRRRPPGATCRELPLYVATHAFAVHIRIPIDSDWHVYDLTCK